jgi:threonine/homoserine/homoserine lactone efflux protein
MDYAALVPYFIASTIFLVAPGPLMAVLIARSVGNDPWGASAFAGGLCLGVAAVVSAVALGVGIWAEGSPEVLSIAKYVGVSYLLWLAFGMWNDRAKATETRTRKKGLASSTCAGVVLGAGTPSILLFYMLMLPSVAPAGMSGLERGALVVLVTSASAALVFFGTVLLAGQLTKLLAATTSASNFSRIAAAATALTGVWILAA